MTEQVIFIFLSVFTLGTGWIVVTNRSVSLRFSAKRKKDRVSIKVYGVLRRIEANRLYTFLRRDYL